MNETNDKNRELLNSPFRGLAGYCPGSATDSGGRRLPFGEEDPEGDGGAQQQERHRDSRSCQYRGAGGRPESGFPAGNPADPGSTGEKPDRFSDFFFQDESALRGRRRERL